MQKLEVINKPLRYGGKTRKVGEVFDCEDRFVMPLMRLNRVELYIEPEPVPEPPKPKRATRRRSSTSSRSTNYRTRAMSADDVAIQEENAED